MKLVRKDDHDNEIRATVEIILGYCDFTNPTLNPDGTYDFDWCGGTEISWDSQVTKTLDGKRVFLDANWNEVTEDEIELIEDQPEED